MVYHTFGLNYIRLKKMYNYTKSRLKNNLPGFYEFSKKIFHIILYILQRYIFGTGINKIIWRNKHFVDKNFRKFVNNDGNDNRMQRQIVNVIKKYPNTNSLIDIGFGLGKDLKEIRKNYKKLNLYGVEINKKMFNELLSYFKHKKDYKVKLYNCTASKLDQLENDKVDILLCNAVLMFITPNDIIETLKEFCRVTKKVIILNEYNLDQDFVKSTIKEKDMLFGNKNMYYKGGRWIYDYEKLFAELVPKANVKKYPSKKNNFVNDDWSTFGSLFVIELNKDKK
tara:strand:+ start:319 stop:1164 length:846 start_codon:yes stop_codon:yes gene_type:complete